MNHRVLATSALAIAALGLASALRPRPPRLGRSRSDAPPLPSYRPPPWRAFRQRPGRAYPLRCTVTASNVNYRRGPGTQYASYGQLPRGFTFASQGALPNPRIRLPVLGQRATSRPCRRLGGRRLRLLLAGLSGT